MDDQIDDCDPQQYREEWFDIAINPIGREFELPNISNTPAISCDHSPAIATNQICVHSALLAAKKQLQFYEVPFSDAFRSCILAAGQLRHQNNNSHFNKSVNARNSSPNFSNHENPRGSMSSCCLDHVHNHAIDKLEWLTYSKMEFDQSKTIKTSTEAQSDLEGEHRCFVCNVTFATGNALGGHMSSHAKKRKMEVLKNGGDLSIFKSENGSNQQPNETSPITNCLDCHSITASSTAKKIEGKTRIDADHEDGLSTQ